MLMIKCMCTAELHLPVLIGTASHPDMQKIRIIGFFFENGLHWQFEVRLLLYTGLFKMIVGGFNNLSYTVHLI